MTNPETIAAGLTEAQRRWVLLRAVSGRRGLIGSWMQRLLSFLASALCKKGIHSAGASTTRGAFPDSFRATPPAWTPR